jgi:hypothetical protein
MEAHSAPSGREAKDVKEAREARLNKERELSDAVDRLVCFSCSNEMNLNVQFEKPI